MNRAYVLKQLVKCCPVVPIPIFKNKQYFEYLHINQKDLSSQNSECRPLTAVNMEILQM